MGCSTQSVPSWSKVAMRSSGGTNFGLAGSVVTRTKSRIACFAGPSFHEANGSDGKGPCAGGPPGNCACAAARRSPDSTTGAANHESRMRRRLTTGRGMIGFMFDLPKKQIETEYRLPEPADQQNRQ